MRVDLSFDWLPLCPQVFGVLASSPLQLSDGFYGTGESFLFTFDTEGGIQVTTGRWKPSLIYDLLSHTRTLLQFSISPQPTPP